MLITRRSQISGEVNTFEVNCTPEQIAAWERGALIQDAMPNFDAPLREFIKSGITPQEWIEMFGGRPVRPDAGCAGRAGGGKGTGKRGAGPLLLAIRD